MIDPGLPADESARLAELRALAILDTPREDAFDNLMQLAASIFGVPIALVALVDEARQWFKAAHGLSVSQTPRDISFCTHVVFSGEALVVEDANFDGMFTKYAEEHELPLTFIYAIANGVAVFTELFAK